MRLASPIAKRRSSAFRRQIGRRLPIHATRNEAHQSESSALLIFGICKSPRRSFAPAAMTTSTHHAVKCQARFFPFTFDYHRSMLASFVAPVLSHFSSQPSTEGSSREHQPSGSCLRSTVVDAGPALRTTMAAVRLSFIWFGVRKSLSPQQKALAAESFGAEGEYLSAGKKLLDTKHHAFRAVTAVRGKVQALWKGQTLPYPEPGMRLIRQDGIEGFDEANETHARRTSQRRRQSRRSFRRTSLRGAAALGEPCSIRATIPNRSSASSAWIGISRPSNRPNISKGSARRSSSKSGNGSSARFEEAVRLAEQAFTDELSKLVSHLIERLTGTDDGKPKVFRDSAVNNLSEFFERFRQLNVRSNDELDDLVERAQRIVGGVEPNDLRDNLTLRDRVAVQLGKFSKPSMT